MRTNYFDLGLIHSLISRSLFSGFLIITLIQSIQKNQALEKDIFRYDLDIAEIIFLFLVLINNITIFIKLKKIVRRIFI